MTLPNHTMLPLPTKSSRLPAYKSRSSARGWAPIRVPADQGRMRVTVYESWLEYHVLWLLLLRCDLHDLWSQPDAIYYRNIKGERRKYVFDFMFVSVDGRRTAIAVRPSARVSPRYREILDLAFSQMPREFADTAILVTDKDFDRKRATEAKELLINAKSVDPAADAALLYRLSSYPEGAPLFLLAQASGLEERAAAAAVRLWQRREIHAQPSGVIDMKTVFKAALPA